MARLNRRCAAAALDQLEVGTQDRVLEIGFGSGVGIALAAGRGALIAGADPSREMVAQAAARNRAGLANGRVDLRQAAAERLPFDHGVFDKVFAVNSMQMWEREPAFGEIRRVLKPGGRLALAFTPNSGQSRNGVVETLAVSGFRNPRLVDMGDCFCALAENP